MQNSSTVWISNNPSEAVVDQNGLITGLSAGTADIEVSGGVPTFDWHFEGFDACGDAVGTCNPGNGDFFELQADVFVKPKITSITPAKGIVGATTSVTIAGRGLSGATVNAGSAITVTVTSSSDTQVQASFAVSAGASGGNTNVTVTTNSEPSNSATFFIQIPSSLSIVLGTDSTLPEASCSAGSFGTGCGVARTFNYQVNDQSGIAINQAGLEVWDAISISSTQNQLGITGAATTCTFAGLTNSGPCGQTTNASGQFQERPGLSICSTACRVNNACTTAGGNRTDATQTVHVGSSTISQSVSYFCNRVTVNGQ